MIVRLSPTPRAPRLGRSELIVCFYGLLSAIALCWSTLRGHPNILLHSSRPSYSLSHVTSSLAIGLALGLLVVFLTRILQERCSWARTLHNEFRHLLGSLEQREILLLATTSAIGEELFFRGALQAHLEHSIHDPALSIPVAILGSSLLFALLHIGPGARFLGWTFSSFLIGLLLGTTFVACGDLIAPIVIHFTINLLNLQDIVRRQMEA